MKTFQFNKSSRVITLLAGSLVLSACGGGTGSDEEEVAGDANQNIDLPQSQITLFVSSIEVAHDCDPNQENPGDFKVITEFSYGAEDNVIADNSASFTLHSGESRNLVDETLAQGTIAREEHKILSFSIDTSERDSGNRDKDSTRIISYDLEWDQNNWCWRFNDSYCLETNDAINWRTHGSIHHLGREDEFKLFNPDDEGCGYSLDWHLAIEDDGSY